MVYIINWDILACYHCVNKSSITLYNHILFALFVFDLFGDSWSTAGHIYIKFSKSLAKF